MDPGGGDNRIGVVPEQPIPQNLAVKEESRKEHRGKKEIPGKTDVPATGAFSSVSDAATSISGALVPRGGPFRG